MKALKLIRSGALQKDVPVVLSNGGEFLDECVVVEEVEPIVGTSEVRLKLRSEKLFPGKEMSFAFNPAVGDGWRPVLSFKFADLPGFEDSEVCAVEVVQHDKIHQTELWRQKELSLAA